MCQHLLYLLPRPTGDIVQHYIDITWRKGQTHWVWTKKHGLCLRVELFNEVAHSFKANHFTLVKVVRLDAQVVYKISKLLIYQSTAGLTPHLFNVTIRIVVSPFSSLLIMQILLPVLTLVFHLPLKALLLKLLSLGCALLSDSLSESLINLPWECRFWALIIHRVTFSIRGSRSLFIHHQVFTVAALLFQQFPLLKTGYLRVSLQPADTLLIFAFLGLILRVCLFLLLNNKLSRWLVLLLPHLSAHQLEGDDLTLLRARVLLVLLYEKSALLSTDQGLSSVLSVRIYPFPFPLILSFLSSSFVVL